MILKQLRIQNLILVEEADIQFARGLNVLTGETGSGKSAIMLGIGLATGIKADVTLIRQGAEKGVVEAIFELPESSLLHTLLKEGGIECEPDLLIRRELFVSGKNRLFINHQIAQLSFLRKLSPLLIQIVGQQTSQQLYSLDYHRYILDLFGSLDSNVEQFKSAFRVEIECREELARLIGQETERIRKIETTERELAELEEARLQPGEDELLFREYELLAHAEEIALAVDEIYQGLSGERMALLAQIQRWKQNLENLGRLDPHLTDLARTFQGVLLELQEAAHTLRLYQGGFEPDSNKLQKLEQRLSQINRLKRKYGPDLEHVLHYSAAAKKSLEQLHAAEGKIEELQASVKIAEEATQRLAALLSEKRRATVPLLEQAMERQLQALNMEKAQFRIKLSPQKTTLGGNEQVEFFLKPNIGEREISLKDAASGGEISRVLLAIHTILAGKAAIPTLIFDEVDANIGGRAASVVGAKLKEISLNHQLICITHFPQVAIQADHHLQIFKTEREGRTFTQITALSTSLRDRELARMSGI